MLLTRSDYQNYRPSLVEREAMVRILKSAEQVPYRALLLGDHMMDIFWELEAVKVMDSGCVVTRPADIGAHVAEVCMYQEGETPFGVKPMAIAHGGALAVDTHLKSTFRMEVCAPEPKGSKCQGKWWFMCNGRPLLRVDGQSVGFSAFLELEPWDRHASALDNDGVDVLVLVDYGKGALSDYEEVGRLVKHARAMGIPVVVEAGGARSLVPYLDANCIKMTAAEMEKVHARGEGSLNYKGMLVLTRGEHGLTVEQEAQVLNVPRMLAPDIRPVKTLGAGDMVTAALAASFAMHRMHPADDGHVARHAYLAAIASQLSCVYGTEFSCSLPSDILWKELHPVVGKHFNWEQAKVIIGKVNEDRGLKVGFANGCFDLLHEGHRHYLMHSKERCGFLVVGVNADASVRALKGPGRPVQHTKARVANVASLPYVDAVVVFDEATPEECLKALNPQVLIKGHDHDDMIGHGLVGEIIVAPPLEKATSTTDLIAKAGGL